MPAGEDGLSVEAVRRENPSLVYVMPSHQFPLGSVMPLGERIRLLAWAAGECGRYLIEDDHDSEYRYRGKPIPSLQSIDQSGKVIYLGTFSKSIAPSLRISYMVLPPELLERYRNRCGFYATTVPRMQQEILNSFIREGHFERHLNKMRGIYRSRHDFLLGELKKREWVRRIVGEYAGLHFLVEVESALAGQEICARAAQLGVGVSDIEQYDLRREKAASGAVEGQKTEYPLLLLGYGRLHEAEMEKGLVILDKILSCETHRDETDEYKK